MNHARRAQLVALLQRLGLDGQLRLHGVFSAQVLAVLDEALSHTSAGLERDHERLEFLGDAVLRLAATAYLQRHHPGLRVAEHSSLRAQLVSDRWLTELAERCELFAALRVGPLAAADRAARATLLAETCEALVGGLYEATGGADGGLHTVLLWLTPHWGRSCAELLADPHLHNWKSALQEWSQASGHGLPLYECEERSRAHGDPRRFRCSVSIASGTAEPLGEGWGGSRRQAEQRAAQAALALIRLEPG